MRIVTRFRCVANQRGLPQAALLPDISWVTLSTEGSGGERLPAGRIEMMVLNPLAAMLFEKGAVYEVSFLRLDSAPVAPS